MRNDDRVSDALDRKIELEAAARAVLTAWDAYIDSDEFDPLVDTIAELRALIQ